MPFVTKKHRENPDINIPGDRCFLFYRDMVKRWKESPRWTTANEIYHEVMQEMSRCGDCRYCSAQSLAWQVFFQLYVMPYEFKKREENGDIQ